MCSRTIDIFGLLVLVYCLFTISPITSLNNGLALSPPMGWLSWYTFGCNTDCVIDHDNCINLLWLCWLFGFIDVIFQFSVLGFHLNPLLLDFMLLLQDTGNLSLTYFCSIIEDLYLNQAEILCNSGYRDAGYVYLNIDDCWMAKQRDNNGRLVADRKRFPNGIHFLADFAHEHGLKLGIYQSFGEKTCEGYPGTKGYIQHDVDTFSKWKVDMVKLDACYTDPRLLNDGYVTFGKYLNMSSQPMVYSCSWPYYQYIAKMEPNFSNISSHCNMWRTYHDIGHTWKAVEQIIDHMGDHQEHFTRFTGPGTWNDPDMIIIGNYKNGKLLLTHGQSRAQMAVWSMIPAPLLMGNDLRYVDEMSKKILLNKNVIAINQDPLGLPGKRVYKKDGFEIWQRPVMPKLKNETSFALLFLNRASGFRYMTLILEKLGMTNKYGYRILSVFKDISKNRRILPHEKFIIAVPAQDVVMYHCFVL